MKIGVPGRGEARWVATVETQFIIMIFVLALFVEQNKFILFRIKIYRLILMKIIVSQKCAVFRRINKNLNSLQISRKTRKAVEKKCWFLLSLINALKTLGLLIQRYNT